MSKSDDLRCFDGIFHLHNLLPTGADNILWLCLIKIALSTLPEFLGGCSREKKKYKREEIICENFYGPKIKLAAEVCV